MNKACKNSEQTVLIVYAHPEPKSFNGALRDAAVETLEKQGYNVLISDLYAQHFEARNTRNDIIGETQDLKHFSYVKEINPAYKNGKISHDVKCEIEKVKKADLIIFQFPIQWCSVPAILKGWFDRVLISGFAFELPKMLDEGLLKGKTAMLSFTSGSPGGMYTPIGLFGDLNVILWPIQYCTLWFCGLNVLQPQCSYSPAYADDKQRKSMLDSWKNRLENIKSEKPIEFPSLGDFDKQKWFVMSDKYQNEQKNKEKGPTVAHHMGKRVPSNM